MNTKLDLGDTSTFLILGIRRALRRDSAMDIDQGRDHLIAGLELETNKTRDTMRRRRLWFSCNMTLDSAKEDKTFLAGPDPRFLFRRTIFWIGSRTFSTNRNLVMFYQDGYTSWYVSGSQRFSVRKYWIVRGDTYPKDQHSNTHARTQVQVKLEIPFMMLFVV